MSSLPSSSLSIRKEAAFVHKPTVRCSPRRSWGARPWSLVWFFREQSDTVNAILVLIILHYISGMWCISTGAYQTPEHSPRENKGDRDSSNAPLGQASWRAGDIPAFNAACPGLVRVGSAHACPQPTSTAGTHYACGLHEIKVAE